MVTVLAEALDVKIGVDARALIYHAEGNRGRRAVLVPDDFFRIEIVDALVLARIAAERKATSHLLEGRNDTLPEVTGEDRRFGGFVVSILSRLGANLNNLARLNNDHALSVIDCDTGTVGNDVILSTGVGTAPL